MPTYEYHCDSCEKNFDVVQSFHDEALTSCPTCGSPVRKVFGNVGIVFKGSGFYKTDSRNGGSKKPVAADAAAKSGSEGSGAEGTGSGAGSGDSGSGSDNAAAKSMGDGSGGATNSESKSKSGSTPATTPAKTAPSPSTP